jgi:hypothetical protein
MNHETLIYIPAKAKIFIIALGMIVFFISITLVFFSLYYKIDIGIVTTALTLAQTCAAGLSVIALVFFTKFSVDVDDIRSKITSFLVDEMPKSLRIVEYENAGFHKLNRNYSPPSLLTRTELEIDHYLGNHYCQYKIYAYNICLRVYVQINVQRMVVSYFLGNDPSEETLFRERLDYVVSGSVAAGFSYEYKMVHDKADNTDTLQLRMFRELSEEFLMKPAERLFVANDFASMTRALMRALEGASEFGRVIPFSDNQSMSAQQQGA